MVLLLVTPVYADIDCDGVDDLISSTLESRQLHE